MSQTDNARNPIVEVYLREYEALRDEVLKKIELQSQIQLATMVAIGGLIPLLQYVDTLAAQGRDAYSLLLLAAVPFCATGWHQMKLENGIVEIGNYLATVLTPRLCEALEVPKEGKDGELATAGVLGWESHWRRRHFAERRLSELWIGIGAFANTGLSLVVAVGLLVDYALAAHVGPQKPWTPLEVVFCLTVAFGALWMIVSGLIVNHKYSTEWR